MKKLTLALLSVLAFGSAAAAQDSVTVYGRIDLGVGISRINDGFGSKENNAQMVTGAGTSNRIGIKGEEDLDSIIMEDLAKGSEGFHGVYIGVFHLLVSREPLPGDLDPL